MCMCACVCVLFLCVNAKRLKTTCLALHREEMGVTK